jgi:hypothetical protein
VVRPVRGWRRVVRLVRDGFWDRVQCLGFGRIDVSKIEAPNMLANLV